MDKRLKIVFSDADTLGNDISLLNFNDFGDVTFYGLTGNDELKERTAGFDILVTNKNVCNEETLGTDPTIKMIAVTATGTNIIDMEYAKKHGIVVANVKGYSSESVAQHTFAMLFYLIEKCAYYDKYVKDGNYVNSAIFTHFGGPLMELCGKTWGIVGLGDIGRRVADIAKAFGCRVIYYSTSGRNNNAEYERVEFDELLENSDVISIHAPLTEKTEKLFDKAALGKMKKSAYLINVGRGPIIDEKALFDALTNNEIAGAGLDVLSVEPMREDNPLLNFKDSERLFITPHVAWATVEARMRLMSEVYENIKAFTEGNDRNRVV